MAELQSGYCPELPLATLSGDTILSRPSLSTRFGKYPPSDAVGVAQDEQPAPAVASARFSRCEQARLNRVTQAVKASDDVGESQREVALDVFAEDPFGADLVDDAGDVGPEVARIRLAPSLAGEAEGLAGITGSDEMNAAAERAAVEGSKVVPDRRRCQGLVAHPRHERGRSVALPLDESHSAISGLGDMQAEIEAGVAGTERDPPEVSGFTGEAGR